MCVRHRRFKKIARHFERFKPIVELYFSARQIDRSRIGVQDFIRIHPLKFYGIGSGKKSRVDELFRFCKRASVCRSYFRDDHTETIALIEADVENEKKLNPFAQHKAVRSARTPFADSRRSASLHSRLCFGNSPFRYRKTKEKSNFIKKAASKQGGLF